MIQHINRDTARATRAVLALFVGAASAFGCSGDGALSDSTETGTAEDPLYYRSTTLWPQPNIKVCWFATPGFAAEKALVYQAFKGQRSWEAAGNVNLVGWGDCPASGFQGIRLQSSYRMATTPVGRPASGVVDMELDFNAGIEAKYVRCVDNNLSRDECIKTVALHELGHALSIAHEQNRPDKPASCTASTQGANGDMTFGGFDDQSIMNYCNMPTELSGIDRRGFDRVYGQRNGDTRQLDDMNGDGRADMLCHDASFGGKWITYASSAGNYTNAPLWTDLAAQWCYHGAGRLFKGDFNGDSRADMLCHDVADGRKWLRFANSAGQYTGSDTYWNTSYCSGTRDRLVVGDYNGDGRDDLLCFTNNTGAKQISYASSSGTFSGPTWSHTTGWCSHATGRLYAGDFNGDSRDDLLCHDVATGDKWFDYANTSGQFGTTDYFLGGDWCSHDAAELHVADMNGDGRDDLFCHDTTVGWTWGDYATATGEFNNGRWHSATNFCGAPSNRLFTGDINGDGKDDLLCHDVTVGAKAIDFANSQGRYGGSDWVALTTYCTQDSGELH